MKSAKEQIGSFFLWVLFPLTLLAGETSYSLNDSRGVPLDQKLVKLLPYENGVFIEVGAFDGITQSNTKRLEEFYGWTGILVEPSQALFAKLCANRPGSRCFSCALGPFDQNNTYAWGDFDGKLMSSMNGSRLKGSSMQQVLVRSLQSILDEVGIHQIDLFSLDVEGYELSVLQGIDFNRTQFDYLLIEIYSNQHKKIVLFLLEKGYDLIENFSNYNRKLCPLWDGSHNDFLFKRRDL